MDRFAGLGRSPFDLAPPDGRPPSLADVVRTQRPHDRSAGYLRYRPLGGDARLQAIQAIQGALDVPLVTSDEHDWPSRLKALEVAQERIVELGPQRSERIRVAGQLLQIVLGPDLTSP